MRFKKEKKKGTGRKKKKQLAMKLFKIWDKYGEEIYLSQFFFTVS